MEFAQFMQDSAFPEVVQAEALLVSLEEVITLAYG